MILHSPAFLAMWNACNPSRRDYDAWHTLEHVPERLSVPGFLGARRYVGGEGPLPEYLTVYGLSGLDVLDSRPYRDLLDRPTQWSSEIRPDLSDVIRHGCRTLSRFGRGFGGIAAVKILDLDEASIAKSTADLTLLSSSRFINAATLGAIDSSVAKLPFRLGTSNRSADGNAVLILESFSEQGMRSALGPVDHWLDSSGGAAAASEWTTYRLGFVVEASETPDRQTEQEATYAGATED